MASPLDTIATQMPIASAKRQKQAQATTDFQLQQAIASAPAAVASSPVAASTLGAESAAALGKKQTGIAAAGAQAQEQVGQQALQGQQAALANRLSGLRQGVVSTELAGEKEFAALDADAKRELFDMRMQFAKDAQGREFMTDRQLQDYMVTHAKDVEQFKNYQADKERLADRESRILKHSLEVISKQLEFQNKLDNKKRDQDQILRLTQKKADLEQWIQNRANEEASRKQKLQMGIGIIGAIAGGAAGGPAGAGAGASAGQGIGGMMYGMG